jgi:hypothetical protein
MKAPTNRDIAKVLQAMIVERQRLLIREANYLRAFVGPPPVRAERAGREPPGDARPR